MSNAEAEAVGIVNWMTHCGLLGLADKAAVLVKEQIEAALERAASGRPTEQGAGTALYYEATMLEKWLNEHDAPKWTEDGIVYSLQGRVEALLQSGTQGKARR